MSVPTKERIRLDEFRKGVNANLAVKSLQTTDGDDKFNERICRSFSVFDVRIII